MKYSFLLVLLVLTACQPKKIVPISSVSTEMIYQQNMSVRAIEIGNNQLYFADHSGRIGSIDLTSNEIKLDSIKPIAFRSIARSGEDVFVLSIENPAELYKISSGEKPTLVYTKNSSGVFYDALHFVNANVGYALGDNYDGCMAVLQTLDAGKHWNKINCDLLPPSFFGEGAFAASNSNIDSFGSNVWMATTKGMVYRTDVLGKNWTSSKTPIVDKSDTHGIYSIDFYNEQLGIAYGGDYSKPEYNHNNIALTEDGGAHWSLIADGSNPGYKSCVQFVPNTYGSQIVAVGFTGIAVSNDRGVTWQNISDESFYTLRFIDEHTAYAAGKDRIAKLSFK